MAFFHWIDRLVAMVSPYLMEPGEDPGFSGWLYLRFDTMLLPLKSNAVNTTIQLFVHRRVSFGIEAGFWKVLMFYGKLLLVTSHEKCFEIICD